jgi:hypothetical protein
MALAGVADAKDFWSDRRGVDPTTEAGYFALVREYFDFCMHRLEHKRRGGGFFKPTWYACRVVLRAPAGMEDASDLRRGHVSSILHQRRGRWLLFGKLAVLCVHHPGHNRQSGGCFKLTWYVYRPAPRDPASVSEASGLRRRHGAWPSAGAHFVDPPPEGG